MIKRASLSAALAAAVLGAGAATASAGSVDVTGPATVNEGSHGAGATATFTVTETRAGGETLPAGSWTISAAGGSAAAGADFGSPTPAGGALSTGSCIAIHQCQVVSTVTVPIVGDDVFEGNETFTASVTAPAGVSVSSATTTILDDDPAPPLEVDGERVAEGNAGATQAKVGFELDQPATVPVTIHWETADASATAGSDYAPRSGTTTIHAGDEEAHASVPVNGDTTVEPDEQFRVRVTSVTNATLHDDDAKVTIVNDDVPPPPPPAPSVVSAPSRAGGAATTPSVLTGHATTVVAATTTHAAGGADLAGPAVRLGYAGLSSSGKVKLRVECPATEPDICAIRLRVHTKVRGGDVTLGTAVLRHLRPGQVELVKVALSRRARRTLRRAGRFSVSLRARDAAGNVAAANPAFAQ